MSHLVFSAFDSPFRWLFPSEIVGLYLRSNPEKLNKIVANFLAYYDVGALLD